MAKDERYYKLVKLRSGEHIMCYLTRDIHSIRTVNFLTLCDPVVVRQIQRPTDAAKIVKGVPQKAGFTINPWVLMSSSDTFDIATDIVQTMGDLQADVRGQYISYLQRQEVVREQEERDDALLDLLKSVNPGRPVRFVDESVPANAFEYDQE